MTDKSPPEISWRIYHGCNFTDKEIWKKTSIKLLRQQVEKVIEEHCKDGEK